MKVRVYYNLHKHKWSVQKYIPGKGWRIDHHADSLLLTNAQFKVYDKGREKARREKKKNVHAYVIGEYCGEYNHDCPISKQVYYNPYKVEQFTLDDKPIYKAQFVWMENRRVYV